MNRTILLLILVLIAVIVMTNCGGVVADFDEIYKNLNQYDQSQAILEEQVREENLAQLNKEIQLENERIAKKAQEEFKLTAHLGEWYYTYYSPAVADNGIGKLTIDGNRTWVMSDFIMGTIYGSWVGDANKVEFWNNNNRLYPFGYGFVNENGILELAAPNGTVYLKRYVE